jgi:hypothetical protein
MFFTDTNVGYRLGQGVVDLASQPAIRDLLHAHFLLCLVESKSLSRLDIRSFTPRHLLSNPLLQSAPKSFIHLLIHSFIHSFIQTNQVYTLRPTAMLSAISLKTTIHCLATSRNSQTVNLSGYWRTSVGTRKWSDGGVFIYRSHPRLVHSIHCNPPRLSSERLLSFHIIPTSTSPSPQIPQPPHIWY